MAKRGARKTGRTKAATAASDALAPADELRQLLEQVTERVLDNVDKYGFSIPMCLGHSPAGEDYCVVADSSDPDAEYDPEKSRDSILFRVRKMIEEGQLRAVAFARNLNLTVESDGGPRETAAVKVLLDHQAGGGYTAYVLYHMEEEKAVPDEVWNQELEEAFFPPGKVDDA